MLKKSKQYIMDTDKIVRLLARHKKAEKMRPRVMEWVEATGIPVRSLYDKMNAVKEINEK